MMYYVLYNPLSGCGHGRERAEKLNDIVEGEKKFCDITETDYCDFFAKADGNPVIICGGDGTLNRFINETEGIRQAGKNEILYYACGSGNDFLRDIGDSGEKPVKIDKYLENLPKVEVNGKTCSFLNNVGFGIDGYCTETGDELRESGKENINYAMIAIKGMLGKFKPVNAVVTIDKQVYVFEKVWLAPTMNGRFYGGGMIPTPEQDRLSDDGKLSVMLFYGGGKIKTLAAFPAIFKGEHVKHTDMVKVLTGYDIRVKFDKPCPLQIDGETVKNVSEYHAFAER